MTDLHLEERIPLPAVDVVDVLSSRPTTWLRRFLYLALAAPTAGVTPSGPDATAWFRLGVPAPIDGGAVAVAFSWRPRVVGHLFDRFRGRLVVRPDDAGSVLVLEGEVSGGARRGNDAVLGELLRMLAAALSAAQRTEG